MLPGRPDPLTARRVPDLDAALRDDDDDAALEFLGEQAPHAELGVTHDPRDDRPHDDLGVTRDEAPARPQAPRVASSPQPAHAPLPDIVIPRELTRRPSAPVTSPTPAPAAPNLGPAAPNPGPAAPIPTPAALNPAAPAPTPSSSLRVTPKRPDPPTSGRPAKRPDPPDLSGTIVDPPRPASPISGLTLPDPPQLGPASGPPSIIVAARRPDPPNLGPASGTLTHPDPPPLAAPASRSLDVTRDSHPPASRNLDLRRDTDSLDSTRPDADDPPLAETRAGSSFTRSATPAHRDLATTAAEQSSDLGATLAAPPATSDPIPRQIGRFAVLRRLGRGGMGTVYAAYDEQLTRRVALKVLHAGLDTGDRAPLTAEARAMAQLSHPNVVQIYELGEHDHHPFLAMEYVEGRTLGDWLAAERPPWQLALRRFIAAGEGLAAAHRAGLVHRDFKPDNVLLGADDIPRVADFGLARASAEGVAQIAGTPAYMSPEQHEGTPTDARSDQFSFCIALHEALYGRPPFAGDTYVDRAANVLAGDLQPPPAHGPVPRALYSALIVGLARDPARRYPNMDALLAELRRFLPRPRPTALYVSLAALAVSTLLVLAVVLGRTPPPGASPAAAAAIARHARTAHLAARGAAWIYPPPEPDPATNTAIREIVALEATPAPADHLARKQSERLRDAFAKQLAALGQRYWDAPKTRPFARDFYAQALMFRPEHEQALKRGNFTMGQLAQLRDEAEQSGFTPEQIAAVAPLRILADPDDPRLAGLLAALPAACDAPISQQDPARGSGLAEPPAPAPPPAPEPPAPAAVAPEPTAEAPPAPRPVRPAFDPSALIEEAENARRRGHDDEAARLFRQALAGAPREATALAALSDIAFDRGDFQEAADLAAKATRAAPTIGEHHTRLGDAYLKLKRDPEARAEYQRALDLGDTRARRRLDIDAQKP